MVARRKGGMSSFGAKVNPVGGVTADFGTGYPYYFFTRLTVGAFNVKPLGLDLGVEFQTSFDFYDLSVHGRLQLIETGPLSAAVRANLGGGGGPDGRDTYFMDLSAIASLAFADVATVSATVRFSAWTDRFCPSTTQVANGVSQEPYCTDVSKAQQIFGNTDPNTNRFSGKRVYLGIGASAAIDRYTSFFLQLEFLPAPDTLSPSPRPAFEGAVDGTMLSKDTFIYGLVGFSLKF